MAQRIHHTNSRSGTLAGRSRHHTIPQIKKDKKIPFKKNRKHINENKKLNTLHTIISPSGVNDTLEGPSPGIGSNNDEEEADDDDHPKIKAPPKARKQFASKNKVAAWAGIEDEQMSDSDSSEIDTNITEGGDDFDIAEDDDNYDDVDQMSEVSDDSARFEAEVEREILAQGEHGIDWDDENIFGYTGQESQYFLQEMANSDTLFGVDTLALDFVETIPQPIAEPEPVMGHPVVEFHTRAWSPDIAWSASSSSASNASVRSASESPSRRTSQATGVSDLTPYPLRIDPGEETDEEEAPVATVSTPSVTLSRQNSRSSPSSVRGRVIDLATPRRATLKGPIKRTLKTNPNKPIAYYVNGSSVMVFKTPKGTKLKWLDMRSFNDSPDSSGPSSPTMIDLDAALREGNQRTGAAITDVIYGQMFRQYHCTPFSLVVNTQPTSHAEFSRVPLMNGATQRGPLSLENHNLLSDAEQDTGAGLQSDMGLMELIDFDGGVAHSESVSDDEDALESAVQSLEVEDDTGNQTHGAGLDTPTPRNHLAMDTSSSPLKRRAEPRSVSPALKKKQRSSIAA